MTETKPATKRGEVVSSSQLPTIKDIKESVIILNKEDKEGKVVSTTQKNILDFWEMERLLSAHEQHYKKLVEEAKSPYEVAVAQSALDAVQSLRG
jgi:hypothetical protein